MVFQKYFVLLLAASLYAAGCTDNNDPDTSYTSEVAPPRTTIADVEAGIRHHIDSATQAGNGYFSFATDSTRHRLKLVRVHTEYLSVLGPHRFFACVDLADTSGDVYDVDFFLEGAPGDMMVTQTTLHKRNGQPFYTWAQKEDNTWYTVPLEAANNRLLGVIEGEDHFEFYYDVILPQINAPGELWLPLAISNAHQQVKRLTLEAPGEQQILTDAKYGNKILYLKLSPEHSGKKIHIAYEVLRKEKKPYPAPQPNPTPYLMATDLLPTGGRFEQLAQEALAGRDATTPLMQARALYDYIIENMRYAKQGTYGTGDAAFACDAKSGNCTEFHSLFISMARSIDLPARFAIGAAIPAARDEGGVNGYHCWAEFYADGKWWPVDISEGNKYTALATYYFGHHPANRIALSRGRNLEVTPGPASGIPFLAYPILEVDGIPKTVKTSFSFQRLNKQQDTKNHQSSE